LILRQEGVFQLPKKKCKKDKKERSSMMYFEKAGPENTDKALDVAFTEADRRGIKNIVIASTWGDTAVKAAKYLANGEFNLVAVTHNTGFKVPGVQEFSDEARRALEEAGGRVLTGTMPTRTLGRAIKNKLGFSQDDIVCAAWRMFGEGTKVCVEIAAMACDAGMIPPGDTITVAGTGKGADTVLLVSALPSNETFGIKIREVLAKPRDW
jgi:uncharacterized protein